MKGPEILHFQMVRRKILRGRTINDPTSIGVQPWPKLLSVTLILFCKVCCLSCSVDSEFFLDYCAKSWPKKIVSHKKKKKKTISMIVWLWHKMTS